MKTPIIWIFIPILAGIALLFLSKWEKWIRIAALALSFILTLLAFGLPVNQAISFRLWAGFPTFTIGDSVLFFGARFTIDRSVLSILAFMFLGLTIWDLGLVILKSVGPFFALSLIIMGLVAAGLSLNPRAYAPLLFLAAFLIAIPVFSAPGERFHPGTGRFMIAQVIGMMLILLANLMIIATSIQSETPTEPVVPLITLGLGVAMVIPIIPFHSWLLMLPTEGKAPENRFFMILFPIVSLLLFFEILIGIGLASLAQSVETSLILTGLLLIIYSGLSMAFEKQIGRAFSYAIIHQIGLSLISIDLALFSTTSDDTAGLFFAVIIQMVISLTVWQIAERVLSPVADNLSIDGFRLKLQRAPIASIALLFSIFSLAGLPALPGFPVQLELWSRLAEIQPALVLIGLAGNLSLSVFGIRLLGRMVERDLEQDDRTSESRLYIILLIAGILSLLILGLIPSLYSS
jgi:formate hydrogenlyase subunit 3/multisubunit Na+/H+ antiporter MnhD subunit